MTNKEYIDNLLTVNEEFVWRLGHVSKLLNANKNINYQDINVQKQVINLFLNQNNNNVDNFSNKLNDVELNNLTQKILFILDSVKKLQYAKLSEDELYFQIQQKVDLVKPFLMNIPINQIVPVNNNLENEFKNNFQKVNHTIDNNSFETLEESSPVYSTLQDAKAMGDILNTSNKNVIGKPIKLVDLAVDKPHIATFLAKHKNLIEQNINKYKNENDNFWGKTFKKILKTGCLISVGWIVAGTALKIAGATAVYATMSSVLAPIISGCIIAGAVTGAIALGASALKKVKNLCMANTASPNNNVLNIKVEDMKNLINNKEFCQMVQNNKINAEQTKQNVQLMTAEYYKSAIQENSLYKNENLKKKGIFLTTMGVVGGAAIASLSGIAGLAIGVASAIPGMFYLSKYKSQQQYDESIKVTQNQIITDNCNNIINASIQEINSQFKPEKINNMDNNKMKNNYSAKNNSYSPC